MNKNKFDETVLGILDECKQLLVTKGQDYSSDFDRLSHFKEAEKFTGLSQWDVWRVLFFKHIQSVRVYFINDRQKLNEDIKHRIRDSINYLILLEAMLVEESEGDKQDAESPKQVGKAKVPYRITDHCGGH